MVALPTRIGAFNRSKAPRSMRFQVRKRYMGDRCQTEERLADASFSLHRRPHLLLQGGVRLGVDEPLKSYQRWRILLQEHRLPGHSYLRRGVPRPAWVIKHENVVFDRTKVHSSLGFYFYFHLSQ